MKHTRTSLLCSNQKQTTLKKSLTRVADMNHLSPKQLYKKILWVGRFYPKGLDIVREKAKKQFFALKNEKDPEKISSAIARGEYVLGELEAFHKFHKYRTLRQRYLVPTGEVPEPGQIMIKLEQETK